MGNFEIFSTRLKDLRTKMKKTQKEFADLVGTTSVTLSAYENGSKKPSLDIVKDIAEKCNVSIDWLCGLSEVEKQKETIVTYSDLIRIIIGISKSIDTHVIRDDNPITDITGIGFDDRTMQDFFVEWGKMKDLYHKCIIDDEVYDLWIEKTLSKYNLKLPYKGFNVDDIHDATDEEYIPFN